MKCETIDLEVPAHSDFVIEGYIDPTEPLRPEGPFGDHTGFYTPVDDYPAFHVTCITHRRDAIYSATIVGKPPMEDLYMGQASARLFLPVFKMNFPEIVDLALPAEGVFHNLVFVSIRKQYPYQAYKIMHGLWGMGQMMFTKIIVVVDAHVNVHDTSDVLFHLCANIDPQRDSLLTKGPCDSLDHAPSDRQHRLAHRLSTPRASCRAKATRAAGRRNARCPRRCARRWRSVFRARGEPVRCGRFQR